MKQNSGLSKFLQIRDWVVDLMNKLISMKLCLFDTTKYFVMDDGSHIHQCTKRCRTMPNNFMLRHASQKDCKKNQSASTKLNSKMKKKCPKRNQRLISIVYLRTVGLATFDNITFPRGHSKQAFNFMLINSRKILGCSKQNGIYLFKSFIELNFIYSENATQMF